MQLHVKATGVTDPAKEIAQLKEMYDTQDMDVIKAKLKKSFMILWLS